MPDSVDLFAAEHVAEIHPRNSRFENAFHFGNVDLLAAERVYYIANFNIEQTSERGIYARSVFRIDNVVTLSRAFDAEKFADAFAERHISAKPGHRADYVKTNLRSRKFLIFVAEYVSYREIEKFFRKLALEFGSVGFSPFSALVALESERFENVSDGKVAEYENYSVDSVRRGTRIGKSVIKVGNVEIRKEGKKTGHFRVVPFAVR